MPKNKPPVPRKSAAKPEDDTEQMALALANLALEIADPEEDAPAVLREKEAELARLVRNALRKKNDEVLYGAIDHARFTDPAAFAYLRSQVEEAAATITLRREGKPAEEIDAFLVPVFASSTGGLKQEQTFQDVAAFELLRASFQQAGLESADATVVLISHAYDVDEIDRISYSQLNDMLREVAATMSEKKMVETPALSASIAGWTGGGFAPEDEAMELRFLLGFVRRRADDPFYAEPSGEAADAWFDARMERYRQWSLDAAPLLQACLAADPSALSLNFLYQDLFFGAKEQGMAELAMLGVISEIGQAMAAHEVDPAELSAIVAPAASEDELMLRVNLYRGGEDGPMVSAEKRFDLAGDVEAELAELCDALRALGIQALSVADKFDADGRAVGVRAA